MLILRLCVYDIPHIPMHLKSPILFFWRKSPTPYDFD